MKTRRSLKITDALLVGRLEIIPGGLLTPPHVILKAWCPFCKRHHIHGWIGADDPPVTGTSGAGGYWIGCDPSPEARAADRATIDQFGKELPAWQKHAPSRRARMAARLAMRAEPEVN